MQFTHHSPLADAFAAVSDPRCRQGRRFHRRRDARQSPFPARDRRMGAEQDEASKRAMGSVKGVIPHASTVHRLFRRLHPAVLSAALTDHCLAPAPGAMVRGAEGVAIDGKAQRGRLAFAGTGGCPVHALSACIHTVGAVLAQEEITSHVEKAAAELSVAPRLIVRLGWRGRVFTGDALFCQRGRPVGSICAQVHEAGGDYLVIVKENQPQLHRDIATIFASRTDPALRAASLPEWDMREAMTEECGHRRHEHRRVIASAALNDYLDWPGVAQVVMVARCWQEGGETKQAVRYGITSLPPQVADAARLGTLARGHWQIVIV